MQRRTKKGEQGYTLTEMLVVIAIIGLIAAVLTPSIFNEMGRARAKAAQLQLETVAAKVEAFRTDVDRYPTASEGLNALVTNPGDEGWSGPYLSDIKAMNDPWGRAIVYVPSSDGATFYVESLGADGKTGGTGLNRDLKAPAGH